MSTERDELMLDSMGPSANGGIEIKTHAGGPETSAALLLMADAMMSALNDNNAENYVEMELRASDRKQYVMTLQRKGHITPHQARVKAEEALAAAQPRTITTTEELDALPVGSVIVDYRGSAYQWGIGLDGSEGWASTRDSNPITTNHLLRFQPLTVLHEGNQP